MKIGPFLANLEQFEVFFKNLEKNRKIDSSTHLGIVYSNTRFEQFQNILMLPDISCFCFFSNHMPWRFTCFAFTLQVSGEKFPASVSFQPIGPGELHVLTLLHNLLH